METLLQKAITEDLLAISAALNIVAAIDIRDKANGPRTQKGTDGYKIDMEMYKAAIRNTHALYNICLAASHKNGQVDPVILKKHIEKSKNIINDAKTMLNNPDSSPDPDFVGPQAPTARQEDKDDEKQEVPGTNGTAPATPSYNSQESSSDSGEELDSRESDANTFMQTETAEKASSQKPGQENRNDLSVLVKAIKGVI